MIRHDHQEISVASIYLIENNHNQHVGVGAACAIHPTRARVQ